MSLVLAVLLVALLLGRLSGGSLAQLGGTAFRDVRLVVLGVAAQATGALAGGRAYPAGLAVSALLAGAFLVRNRRLRGTGLVGLGVAANALVVGLNGAMPVSPQASARAGVPLGPVLSGEDPRHEVADGRTRLRLLGDVVPVPLPVAPQVVSAGDVLVAAGLGQLVLLGMRGRQPQPASERRGATAHAPSDAAPWRHGPSEQGGATAHAPSDAVPRRHGTSEQGGATAHAPPDAGRAGGAGGAVVVPGRDWRTSPPAAPAPPRVRHELPAELPKELPKELPRGLPDPRTGPRPD